MTPKKVQILLIALIAFVGGYFIRGYEISWQWNHYKPNVSIINKEPPTGTPSSIDFNLFWTVWDKLAGSYYDKKLIDPQKMLYGAITGMVNSVGDPYTMFLPPAQQTSFQQQMAGQFEGIGAELSTDKDGHILVMAPLDGSPAEKAGIKSGDIIVGVDGKSTNGWSTQQAVDKIRGQKGTNVTLQVVHKGSKDVQDIKITRGTITVKSVTGGVKQAKDLDNVKLAGTPIADTSVLYIRLSQFGDQTNQDLENLVNANLSKVKDGTVKGIILDLRNNPGGYLTDAQFVAGEFLPQGTPVVMEEEGGDRTTLSVNRQGALVNNIPMVVLINGGSASAAEIVSGALKDNNRAKLVGEQSFGKGTVQQAIDLGGGAGLHVTIAKWLTPNGTWVGRGVDGTGLTPDVKVSLDQSDPTHDTQLEKAAQTVLGQ